MTDTARQNVKNKTLGLIAFAAISALLGSFAGCGKAIPVDGGDDDSSAPSTDTPTVHGGVAGFGVQCPYGNVEEPHGVQLDSASCPVSGGRVQLSAPLQSIILQADCKNRLITARTGDRTFDGTFEAAPDGTFSFTMGSAGYAVLKSGCKVPLSADVSGFMKCNGAGPNSDKADINVDTVWSVRKVNLTPGTATPGDANASCALPPSCALHAATTVHQCNE
jgi:hypothetical protein